MKWQIISGIINNNPVNLIQNSKPRNENDRKFEYFELLFSKKWYDNIKNSKKIGSEIPNPTLKFSCGWNAKKNDNNKENFLSRKCLPKR